MKYKIIWTVIIYGALQAQNNNYQKIKSNDLIRACSTTPSCHYFSECIPAADLHRIILEYLDGWEEFQEIPIHATCIALSPNGKYLAIAEVTEIGIWQLNNQWVKTSVLRQPKGKEAYLYSLRFSPDSNYLAAGSHSDDITFWKIDETGKSKISQTLPLGHWIMSIQFSSDNNYLVATSHKNVITLCQSDKTGTWKKAQTITIRNQPLNQTHIYPEEYLSADISPDGNYVACGSKKDRMSIRELSSDKIETFESRTTSLAFSPDGRYLASGYKIMKIFQHVSDGTWQEIQRLRSNNKSYFKYFRSITFSPDGNHLAAVFDKQIKLLKLDQKTAQWHEKTHNLPSAVYHSLIFSPDCAYLFGISHQNTSETVAVKIYKNPVIELVKPKPEKLLSTDLAKLESENCCSIQ